MAAEPPATRGASRTMLVASVLLNGLLVIALLAQQQLDISLSVSAPRVAQAASSWCPPRPAPLAGTVAIEATGSSPPPPPTAAASTALDAAVQHTPLSPQHGQM